MRKSAVLYWFWMVAGGLVGLGLLGLFSGAGGLLLVGGLGACLFGVVFCRGPRF